MRRYFPYVAVAGVLAVTIGLGATLRAQDLFSTGTASQSPAAAPASPWRDPLLGFPVLDPQIAKQYQELETRVRELASKYRQAESDAQREELHDAIAEATNQQFDLKIKVREMEIERLRKQLQEVEHKVQRRTQLREQIVQRRVAELTREDAELRWDNATGLAGGRRAGGTLGSTLSGPASAPVFPQPGASLPGPARLPGSLAPPANPSNEPTQRSTGNPLAELYGGSNTMSVAEAQARLEIAKRDVELARARFTTGMIDQQAMSKSQGAFELAKIACEDAQRRFDTQQKLLQIEIEKAKLQLESASQELDSVMTIAEKSPDAIAETEVRKAQLAREKAALNLRQLETMAQSLQLSATSAGEEKREESARDR